MRLHCVSLGPRDRGRDHGLLPRFQSVKLSSEAKAMIGDFALALFEWGLKPRPPFAAFFPLDGARSLHMLVRAGYLGRDLLGPKVIANGLIINEAALAATEWRPHNLLRHIQPPQEGEWHHLEIELPVVEAGREPPKDPITRKLGGALRGTLQAIRLELAVDRSAEQVVAEIIEASRPGAKRLDYWATSADLVRIGRFDPAVFRLAIHHVEPDSSSATTSHRLGSAGLTGPEIPITGAARIWDALFWPEAIPRNRLRDDPGQVAIDGMLAKMGEPGVDLTGLGVLMDRWAEAGSSLDVEGEAIVHLAIGAAFRRLFEAQETSEAKLALLKGYIQLWPRLTSGAPMLPASLASKHGLIDQLGEAELELLIINGLGAAYAAATESVVRRGGIAGSRLASVARGLCAVVSRENPPLPSSLSLANVVIERTASAGERDPEAFASMGSEAFALSEILLLRAEDEAEWRAVVPAMVQFWRRTEQSKTATPVVARLLRAPWHAFRGSSGRDERRRTFVAFAMLRG